MEDRELPSRWALGLSKEDLLEGPVVVSAEVTALWVRDHIHLPLS